MRPVVFTFLEFLPVFLRFLPRHKLPKRGNVEYHSVIEVGLQMEVGRAAELVLEIVQLRDELFLLIDFLFELLGLTATSGGEMRSTVKWFPS